MSAAPAPGAARPRRHAWGEPMRFHHKTERECVKCGMVKVTRHEAGQSWVEFWRGFDKLAAGATPECSGVRDG